MDSVFVWAQIIGFCAMCFSICAWQVQEPRKIYALYVPSSFLWSIQYMMLGAPVGAIVAICGASKDAGLAFANPKFKKYFILAHLVLTFSFGLYYFQNWASVFPIIGAISYNLAILLTDQRSFIVRANIIGQICWITYNLSTHAWMGVICASFIIISAIIGMARHEKWQIGKCYKTLAPSLMRSLFTFSSFRTFP